MLSACITAMLMTNLLIIKFWFRPAAENGIAAFTGDGLDEKVMVSACEAIALPAEPVYRLLSLGICRL